MESWTTLNVASQGIFIQAEINYIFLKIKSFSFSKLVVKTIKLFCALESDILVAMQHLPEEFDNPKEIALYMCKVLYSMHYK